MLPMGAAVSCSQFEILSRAIQWILLHVFGVPFMSHILDDFLFFGHQGTNECLKGIQAFLAFTKSVGLPVKADKTVWPSTKVEMHGILFDSDRVVLSLPPDKVEKAKSLVDSCFRKRKVKAVVIQQIHGLLNFACRAVPPGRTFLRRVADLLKGVRSNSHFVRLNREARRDLLAWKYFLDHFNSTPITLPIQWSVDADLKLFSDASGKRVCSGLWQPLDYG